MGEEMESQLLWIRIISYVVSAIFCLQLTFIEIANAGEDRPHRTRHLFGALAMLLLVPIFALRAVALREPPLLPPDMILATIMILSAIWPITAIAWGSAVLWEKWRVRRLRKELGLDGGQENG